MAPESSVRTEKERGPDKPAGAARLVTRLARDEAADVLLWLASGIRAGEIAIEQGARVERFVPADALHTTLRAESRRYAGHVRLTLAWEAPTDGLVDIELD